MKKHSSVLWGWFVVSLVLFAGGCAKEAPDPPRHLNPLDPATELEGENPFQLTADLEGEAVLLTWTAPGMTEIAGWVVLRDRQITLAEPDTLALLDLSSTTFLDANADPGERYYYRVLARDRAGRISAGSHLAVVSLETRPIIRIDGDSEFAMSRRVSLTVLASQADSMRIANDPTFTGRGWGPFESQVTDWLLDSGEGVKVVYLQIRYSDGRMSPTVADTVYPEPISDRKVSSEQGTAYFLDLTASLILRVSGTDSVKIWNSGESIPTLWTPFPPGADSLILGWTFPAGEGWKDLVVRCKDDFLVEVGPDTLSVAADLSPPVALFDVWPSDSTRRFAVDASPSYDSLGVTPGEDLLFSWQWEATDAWTPWSTEEAATHTYGVFGPKTLRLQVMDGAGRTDTLAYALTALNRAPTPPKNPFPADGAADQSLLPRLAWGGSEDIEQDAVTYSVYLGTDADPTEVLVTDLPDTTYPLPALEPGQTYFWTVVAVDEMGGESGPSTWSFATHLPSGQDYALASSFGTQGEAPGQFEVVRDVAVDPRGRIYAADLNNGRVQVFSLPGIALREITLAAGTPIQSPYGLATDGEAALFVVDQNAHRVAKFDSAGQYLWSIGGRGSADGEFQFPRDACVDASGNLYVTDTGNHRVQKFDSGGAFLGKWGTLGSDPGDFDTPYGLAEAGGALFVADSFNRRVQKFGTDGTFILSWDGFAPGSVPGAIAADSGGNAYVLESDGRVYKFDASGALLSSWGDEIGSPADGLWVDPGGNLVWVADTYNHRILVFERQ